MLTVHYRVDKPIEELFSRSHEQGLDKVHHLKVFFKVVLKWSSSEDNSSRGSNPVDCFVNG